MSIGCIMYKIEMFQMFHNYVKLPEGMGNLMETIWDEREESQ
jgi:hypothetical protein